jgi:predicted RNase H-like HicB family nuclease
MTVTDIAPFLTNKPGWKGVVADVLGCVATGDTIEACVSEMRAALASHLDLMREYGEATPEPSGPGVNVKRTVAA